MSSGKVIGYIAYLTKLEVLCEGDSAIVAGSRQLMQSYIAKRNPGLLNKVTITKARFGDIRKCMELGAAYSFDKDAYERFQPLAKKSGIDVGPQDFSGETPTGLHFVRVQKTRVSGN